MAKIIMNLSKNNKFKPKKILIRAANWVGDAIMTTPVIRAIRKNFPEAHISILAKPWVAPVFENNQYIDKIIIYDAVARHKKGVGTIRLCRDLRKYKFDFTILMQNAFEAALITFLAGIPNRIGYDTDARTLLLDCPVHLDPALKKGHLIDYYLGILKGSSLKTYGRKLNLDLSLKERQKAVNTLKINSIYGNKIIGINPGATGGTAKRWFPDRYALLCKYLYKITKTKILIFGGPGDETLGDQISKDAGNCCINLSGKTSLREAFALINKCNLFITNDSGLMHAAAALNICQIAIIGSTDHIATPPSNENSHIMRVPTSCSPCLKPECPTDHRCMKRITVDMVLQLAKKLI